MNNNSRKIYIGKSNTHGKGLFVSKNIKKGEIIFFVKGKNIKFFITDEKKAKKAGLNWMGVGKNKWIDPNHEYGMYFNHSCDPNTAIIGKVTVVAIKNIKKGEEIMFDYSTTEADIFWSMECKCGARNCRKIIKSIQFLPSHIYKKYSVCMPSYYKMVYNKFNYNKLENKSVLNKEWVKFLLRNEHVKQ